jgi:transposase
MQNVTLVGVDLDKHSFIFTRRTGTAKRCSQEGKAQKDGRVFCRVSRLHGGHGSLRRLAVFGHPVKLISLQFVRPFVKSNKNDFVDAEAICEAASPPAMGTRARSSLRACSVRCACIVLRSSSSLSVNRAARQ